MGGNDGKITQQLTGPLAWNALHSNRRQRDKGENQLPKLTSDLHCIAKVTCTYVLSLSLFTSHIYEYKYVLARSLI